MNIITYIRTITHVYVLYSILTGATFLTGPGKWVVQDIIGVHGNEMWEIMLSALLALSLKKIFSFLFQFLRECREGCVEAAPVLL